MILRYAYLESAVFMTNVANTVEVIIPSERQIVASVRLSQT